MAAFASELEHMSIDDLLDLLRVYFVKDYLGQKYEGRRKNIEIIRFIEGWLQPENNVIVENNFLQAIQDGVAFNSNLVQEDLINQIFDPSITSINISPDILDDFARYPMRKAFEYHPWDLLQGYIRADSPKQYFQEITQTDPNAFLNNTERLFYLTRGYGRPNKYISLTDLKIRSFLGNSAPTSLLVLMDLFGICPDKQNPNIVREHLSSIDLKTIPKFYRNAIYRINECLEYPSVPVPPNNSPIVNNVCDVSTTIGLSSSNLSSCDTSKIDCFQAFLRSIGVLDIANYDSIHNVFISNLSQLGQYEKVVPENKYSFEEIADMSQVYVSSIIRKLPDPQILAIQVPSGLRLIDQIDLTNLNSRLRTNLISQALRFLNRQTYYFLSENDGLNLVYGRLASSELDQMNLEELEESINKHDALIDPFGNIMHLDMARVLNQKLNSEVIRNTIDKTEKYRNDNIKLIDSMSFDFREDLKLRLFELTPDYKIEKINSLLNEFNVNDNIFNLILWSNEDDWSPVSMNFGTYFQQWSPRYSTLIKSTINYYIQIL